MRRALARIASLLASTALGLVLADWAVSRWMPLPAMVFRLDPELLYAPVPHARRVLPLAPGAGGAWITTELESHGFRGPELAAKKSGPRVLVVGDSLVMAQTSPIEDTYCVKLGAELGREVEVVNAGVSGYGPDQECLLLERLLAPLAPDLVVLVICAHNDFGDLVRDKLFRLGTSEQLVRNKPVLDARLVERFVEAERIVAKPALLLALGTLSQPERRDIPGEDEDSPYVEWYLKGAEEEYTEFVLERNDVVRSLFQDYYDADVSIRPDAPSVQFKQRLMEVVLARVRDDCAKAGVPLFVLVVPSSVDLCPSFRMHVDPAQHPGWTPRRMTDTYAAILQRLAIPFVDLAPAFLEAGPEKLYLGRADFHWNGLGTALGARRSVEFLRSRALWPPKR